MEELFPKQTFCARHEFLGTLYKDDESADNLDVVVQYSLKQERRRVPILLKTNPLTRADLDDFVACYNPANRHDRKEAERFRPFTYEELVKRDKANLDIFWLRDESVEDSASLPSPDVLAEEIVEDHRAALEQFEEIETDLKFPQP